MSGHPRFTPLALTRTANNFYATTVDLLVNEVAQVNAGVIETVYNESVLGCDVYDRSLHIDSAARLVRVFNDNTDSFPRS